MAALSTYSATFAQLSPAGVMRLRFDETDGETAFDVVDDLDGSHRNGVVLGAMGSIGDGAVRLDGSDDFVVVGTLRDVLRVAVLGDSLTDPQDGSQPAGQSFVDDLVVALDGLGLNSVILDHAVSGETTEQGLARVDAVIADAPDVVILELGTNDALQRLTPITGTDNGSVEANLRQIITDLRAADIEVLLTGTFGFYPDRRDGTGYDSEEERAEFEQIFAELAADAELAVTLLQDVDGSDKFLRGARVPGATPAEDVIVGGVLGDPALQSGGPDDPDGLHPNAAGVDHIIQGGIVAQTALLGLKAGAIGDRLALAEGTFEMWFVTDSLNLRQTLFAKNAAGNAQTTGPGGLSAQLREGGEVRVIIADPSGTHEVFSAPGTVEVGRPTHVAFSFGPGGIRLFVDGTEVASDPFTGTGLRNAEPLVIGVETGFSNPGGTVDALQRFFDGTIDEFAVYDRALSAAEIRELFMAGAAGNDLAGTTADDTLIGGADDEILSGLGGADLLLGNGGADVLRGGGAGDELRGGGGPDVLWGKAGADALHGGAGDDRLKGNKGLDQLHGGAGDDLLIGGMGDDTLTGGAGSDVFRIAAIDHGVDKVLAFEPGTGGDVIDLAALLDFQSGQDPAAFVRLDEVAGNTKIAADATGAGDDFVVVFNLFDVTGLSVEQMVADGNLVLGGPVT